MDIEFTVEEGDALFPGATPCHECAEFQIATDNQGPYVWRFSWLEPADLGVTGSTYKLWYKEGDHEIPLDCANDCLTTPDLEALFYTVYGTYTDPQTDLEILRVDPVESCNELNFQCWVLEVIPPSGPHIYCCATTGPDNNACTECCNIAISGTSTDCMDDGLGAFKGVDVSFVASSPDGVCDDLYSDTYWEIFVDGNSVATGTGNSGGFVGEVSCSCPDDNYPCDDVTSITVTITAGESGPQCSKTENI